MRANDEAMCTFFRRNIRIVTDASMLCKPTRCRLKTGLPRLTVPVQTFQTSVTRCEIRNSIYAQFYNHPNRPTESFEAFIHSCIKCVNIHMTRIFYVIQRELKTAQTCRLYTMALWLDEYINIPRVITFETIRKSKYLVMYTCRRQYFSDRKHKSK